MIEMWEKMNPRERAMALITVALIIGFLAFFVVRGTRERLAQLDNRIDDLQSEYLTKKNYEMRQTAIRRAFAKVAAEHSSKWTEPEIHDRLRREIYRIAEGDRPGQKLIEIPALRDGGLVQGGEGYREYRISFALPRSPLNDVIEFLYKLQESRQSLSIDRLMLRCRYDIDEVSVRLDVTRIVVDGVDDQGIEVAATFQDFGHNVLTNPGFEQWSVVGDRFGGWESENCTVRQGNEKLSEGRHCAEVIADQPGGLFYAPVELTSGATFELAFAIQNNAPVTVQVFDVGAGQPLEGELEVPAASDARRFRMKFAVPGMSGDTSPFYAPRFVIEEAGEAVRLDDVKLERVRE